MNELGVVISEYHEDLKWVEKIKSPIDVYIYNRQGVSVGMGIYDPINKDQTDIGNLNLEIVKNNGVNINIINMEDDAGFETSTYAYHFYTKYESLNKITVCLQARERGHIGTPFGDTDIIELLNNPNQLMRTKFVPDPPLLSQLVSAKRIIIEDYIDFEFICDRFGYIDPLAGTDYGWTPYINDFTKTPWLKFCKETSKIKWPPDPFNFGAGNQFMVNKNLVLRNPPEYYKDIQDFTITYMDPNPNRPTTQQQNQGPNIMEGIWPFVF